MHNVFEFFNFSRLAMCFGDVIQKGLQSFETAQRSSLFLGSFSHFLALHVHVSVCHCHGVVIGTGKFGKVYSCVNLDNGAIMAVKEV